MKYFYAILSTILLVLIPLIMIPLLDWYQIKFNVSGISLIGVHALMFLITIGMIILVIMRWISAVSDKPFKELFS
jgi:hypothetical protein